MPSQFLIAQAATPAAAALAVLATGTAIKTMLQVKLDPARVGPAIITEWGISFDGFAAAQPVQCELVTTGTVAATVTALVAADVHRFDPNIATPTDLNPFDWGTAASGYDGSVEGTVTETDVFDAQLVAPTNQYIKQWPLGREPKLIPAHFLRIRVNAPATVNAYAYVVIEA